MKSTVGFVLALIGGILGLIGGIMYLVWATIAGALLSSVGAVGVPMAGLGAGFLIGIGIWLIIMNILALVGAMKMKKDNASAVKSGGILALVVGILGMNILVIIGGIFGIVQAGKK